jgi:hypothetical protein
MPGLPPHNERGPGVRGLTCARCPPWRRASLTSSPPPVPHRHRRLMSAAGSAPAAGLPPSSTAQAIRPRPHGRPVRPFLAEEVWRVSDSTASTSSPGHRAVPQIEADTVPRRQVSGSPRPSGGARTSKRRRPRRPSPARASRRSWPQAARRGLRARRLAYRRLTTVIWAPLPRAGLGVRVLPPGVRLDAFVAVFTRRF